MIKKFLATLTFALLVSNQICGDDTLITHICPANKATSLIAFSEDKSVMAIASSNKKLSVDIYLTETMVLLTSIKEGMVNAIALSPNGKLLAILLETGYFKIWDVKQNAFLNHEDEEEWLFGADTSTQLCFSKDSTRLLLSRIQSSGADFCFEERAVASPKNLLLFLSTSISDYSRTLFTQFPDFPKPWSPMQCGKNTVKLTSALNKFDVEVDLNNERATITRRSEPQSASAVATLSSNTST